MNAIRHLTFLLIYLSTSSPNIRRASLEVNKSVFLNITSYAGYLSVNSKSSLFFWYFPALKSPKKSPLLLWLQGGPGSSSLIGLFYENGPFRFGKSGKLSLRKNTWATSHSIIFIDNPVGTGFSSEFNDYAKSEEEIADNLHEALVQFYELFPELRSNQFFLCGESFAGKYLVKLGYKIHKFNSEVPVKINLKGLIIGNGLCDPETQFKYAEYLYYIGLFDEEQRLAGLKFEKSISQYIEEKKYARAFHVYQEYIGGGPFSNDSYFANQTGYFDYYNILKSENDEFIHFTKHLANFLNQNKTREALRVKGGFIISNHEVVKYIVNDFMKPVTNVMNELLKYYRILIYNGQLDIIIPYAGTLNYLNKLYDNNFRKASKKKWFKNNRLVGYVKSGNNLTFVMIRKAGHMVPIDQPVFTCDLIYRFTRNLSII